MGRCGVVLGERPCCPPQQLPPCQLGTPGGSGPDAPGQGPPETLWQGAGRGLRVDKFRVHLHLRSRGLSREDPATPLGESPEMPPGSQEPVSLGGTAVPVLLFLFVFPHLYLPPPLLIFVKESGRLPSPEDREDYGILLKEAGTEKTWGYWVPTPSHAEERRLRGHSG